MQVKHNSYYPKGEYNHKYHEAEYDGVHWSKFPYSPYFGGNVGQYTSRIHRRMMEKDFVAIIEKVLPNGNTTEAHRIIVGDKDQAFIQAVEWMRNN